VEGVAQGLGLEVPPAMPLATDAPSPHYEPSPALSLLARPGESGIKTRKVAILAAHGVDAPGLQTVYADLLAEGAVPRVVAPQLGQLVAADGSRVDVEIPIDAGPSVLYDAVVIADGADSAAMLSGDADAREFVRLQYRHCKPILALGAGKDLLTAAGVPAALLHDSLAEFKQALATHRDFQRESNPAPL
jgi:catalase